jgi:hypothetical protein
VIAEMDLGDAREVCVEEGVPFDAAEPVEALRQKLRAHMCGGGEAAAKSTVPTERAAAAWAFDATLPTQVSLAKGDVVTVVERIHDA